MRKHLPPALLRLAAAAAALSLIAGAAAAQETALIPKRVIYPGEVIDAGSLAEIKLRPSSNRIATAIATLPEEIEGKVAKRTLLPGKVIPMASLREAYRVEAGAPVELSFVQGGLHISTTGVPLQPGAVGDAIKVKNLDSGAVLSGIVMADGSVRVGGR